MFESIQAFDLSILWSLRSYHSQLATWLAFAVSTVAWKGWFWWALIIGCWWAGRRRFAAHVGGALIVATIAGLPLKSLIARARPDLYASQQLNVPMPELLTTTHSFPSGHTLLAAAFAFVVLRYYKDWRAGLAFAFVGMVGVARVYQGLHWPSDVIGSILLGGLAAWAAEFVCGLRVVKRFTEPEQQSRSRYVVPAEFLVPHSELAVEDPKATAAARSSK